MSKTYVQPHVLELGMEHAYKSDIYIKQLNQYKYFNNINGQSLSSVNYVTASVIYYK